MLHRKYIIELVMFLSYALFAASWVIGSILAPTITKDFGLQSVTAATWATNAITIAKILGNLLAAWLLMKLKPKKAFALASLLIVAAMLSAWVGNYSLYVVIRFIMGLGGALMLVYFSPIVFYYFTPAQLPILNGINISAFNLGNIFALSCTGSLLAILGAWQNIVIATSLASLLFLLIWMIVGENFELNKVPQANTEQHTYTLRHGLKDKFNWLLPLTYTGFLFLFISMFSLFPIIPGFAVPGTHLSIVMLLSNTGGLFSGIVGAKIYPFRIPVMRYCGLLVTVFAVIMITAETPAIVYTAAVLAGFFQAFPISCMLTLPLELPNMTPGRATVIFGMLWSIAYLVETILMFIAGLLADYSGNMFTAAVFVVICSSTYFLGSFFLPETGKRKKNIPAS